MRGVPPRIARAIPSGHRNLTRRPLYRSHLTNLTRTTHRSRADRGGGGKGVGGRVFANALPTELAWTTTVQRLWSGGSTIVR